jgi:hypothetical protein
MIVLVHPNLVILLLVAMNPLYLAMTMMHVLLMIATLQLDVPTPRLIAMITICVPLIFAIRAWDAIMIHMNATIKMHATL